MPVFEVFCRAKHKGSLLFLSSKHPSMRVLVWCNRENDVIEVKVDDPSEYNTVKRELMKFATIIGESESNDIHLIESTCFCTLDNSLGMNIEDLPLLLVQPDVIKGGWVYIRLLLFRHEDFAEVMRRLEARGFIVEVLRKGEVRGSLAGYILEANSIFSSLTGKQMDALIRAHAHGYYRLPRGADIQEIAKEESVKRTTFQEHLKKGENKIIEKIIPYMRLYARQSHDAD